MIALCPRSVQHCCVNMARGRSVLTSRPCMQEFYAGLEDRRYLTLADAQRKAMQVRCLHRLIVDVQGRTNDALPRNQLV